MSEQVFHAAASRGHSVHDWLDSYHTFSFADFFEPKRMQFGALRVLNDDVVAGGQGFGTHPHRNMEIVSIPLQGDLEHRDSMGNVAVICQNEVQIMSAGTGIQHSEYNKNQEKPVNFLQIWILPEKMNIQPRYDQRAFDPAQRQNQWTTLIAPLSSGEDAVLINQQAWFSLGNLQTGINLAYRLKMAGQGVYVFVMHGEIVVNGQVLKARDGFGVWSTEEIMVLANENSEVLLMDVPML
ncbi:MAG: hypothetical protein RL368_923 [Pseudomonadota bacterium]|jgi:redox-sensitive bicupin YhaK (pirin superfamily)